MSIEDLIAKGDRVVVRWIARGRHSAEWHGLAATGRRVDFAGMDTYRLEGGRIREWWRNDDLYGLLEQLGGPPSADVSAMSSPEWLIGSPDK
jgi:predicted ester cyclase